VSWPTVALGEISQIVSGATPKTGVSEYWDGDIFWATPADLSKLNAAYIDLTPRTITSRGLASCAAHILPAGSVLLSSRAPIGHVAINRVPMATNQGFKSLIPDPDRLDPKYLYHWLKSKTEYLQSLGNGATFKEVSKAVVSRVEIPLPSLDEQRRIAAILDHVDMLRSLRRRNLDNWHELASSTFYEMFGDPVANPKAWPSGKFGDHVADMQYGPRFYNESYSADGVRIVRITDLDQNGALDFGSMPRMTVTADDELKFGLSVGDIIFARTGATVGKLAVIREHNPRCIAGAYFIRIQMNESVDPDYAAAVLRSKSIQSIIVGGSHQSAQQNFSGPGLRSLPFPVPPIDTQRQFASALAHQAKTRVPVLRAAEHLDQLFACLQSRAFRGEL